MIKTIFRLVVIFGVIGLGWWYYSSINNWKVVTERDWNGSEQRVFLAVADPDLEYRATVSGWIWMRMDFTGSKTSQYWYKSLSTGRLTSVWRDGNFYNSGSEYYIVPQTGQPANCEQYIVGKPYGASIVHIGEKSTFVGSTTTYLRTMGGEDISVGSNTFSCEYSAHPTFRNQRVIKLESRKKEI